MQELAILQPDILISQGKATNEIMGDFLVGEKIAESDLPKGEILDLWGNPLLWLPMHHPTRQVGKIREEWPYYVRAIKKWAPAR